MRHYLVLVQLQERRKEERKMEQVCDGIVETEGEVQKIGQAVTKASPMVIRIHRQATIGIENGQCWSFIGYSASMPASFDCIQLDDVDEVSQEPLHMVNSATQLHLITCMKAQSDGLSGNCRMCNPDSKSQLVEEDFFGMLPLNEKVGADNSDLNYHSENPFQGKTDRTTTVLQTTIQNERITTGFNDNQASGANRKHLPKPSFNVRPTPSGKLDTGLAGSDEQSIDVKGCPNPSSPSSISQRRSNSYPSIKSFDLTTGTQKSCNSSNNNNSMQTSTIKGEPLSLPDTTTQSWPPVDLRRNFVMIERCNEFVIYKVCIYFNHQTITYNSNYFPQFMQPEITKSHFEQLIVTLNGLQVLHKYRKIYDKLTAIKKTYSATYGCIIGFLLSPLYFYYNSKLNSARRKSKLEIEATLKTFNRHFNDEKKSVLFKLISNGDIALLMKKSG